MPSRGPRYSHEEFARRGEAIFERDIRPKLEGADPRDFVVIDIESGAYEIGPNLVDVNHRLRARVPDAQPWVRRVGSPYAATFGGRRLPKTR
jgi:hypothetical protein